MATIEVNYEGMRNLQSACGDQMRTFSKMESFFGEHCSASKFSSIPVLTLFSPVYSDAAVEVTGGLSEATQAAERYRDTVKSNREQYRRDDVQSSTVLAKAWKVTTADYTPPAIAQGNGAVFNYNGNGKNAGSWSGWAIDGAMERSWPMDSTYEMPGPRGIGGRGGFSDLLGATFDGADGINNAQTWGNALSDNDDYEAFEGGGSIDGNTPTFADRQAGAINLFDVSSTLTPVGESDTGPLIEGLKSELGSFIGGINWALEKLGFNLMDKILGPIAGSFADADMLRGNLDRLGGCSRAVGVNFGEIADGVDNSWRASAATEATSVFHKTSKACERQGDALTMVARQVGNFITATYEGVKLVVGIIGLVVDELIGVPLAKLLGWILKGAAKIKRWISLVKRAIEYIDKLKDIVPPLLTAARAFSRMAIAFKLLLGTLAVGGNVAAGNNADNTAESAF
ncbi:hypothetical protein V6K52_06940 [Knoellia sp. S7-12]|uniref:hypothetical protein n=1 Tax=Knoellia sp. S7-12 TaxID=3126698 RepID=UPI003366C485